jgi:protein TonB
MTRLTPPEPPPALPVRAPTAAATSSGSTRFTGRTVEQGPKPAEEERPEPVVFDARVTRRVAPDYPDGARRRQVEGTVEVEFTVMRDGRVSDPIVVAADPPDVFDAAAVSAVRRWRYEPRREDGVPVDHRTRARLEFRLND